MTITIKPKEYGTWIDASYGQAQSRAIIKMDGYLPIGVVPTQILGLAWMNYNTDLDDDEREILDDYDIAEVVNEHLPEGIVSGWWEGDFMIQTDEWWQEFDN